MGSSRLIGYNVVGPKKKDGSGAKVVLVWQPNEHAANASRDRLIGEGWNEDDLEVVPLVWENNDDEETSTDTQDS